MPSRHWNILSKNKTINSIQDVLDVIYLNRGLIDSARDEFLKHDFSKINFNVGEMHQVIARLKQAIDSKEKIIIYGDYDADGVTATAVMWEVLNSLGANVKPYIPHREREGYGMSTQGVDYLIQSEQVKIILTVDQGISCKNQIRYAHEKGIEVIVTDHHSKPQALPDNCLIVHDSAVSGSAVAWKLATALLLEYRTPEIAIQTFSDLPQLSKELLGLAAIGIVCDLVPLIGQSRTLLYYGLKALRQSKRPGLLAIAKKAGIQLENLEVYQIGYVIGPRINAMGRLEHAIDALRLLCTRNQVRADQLASRVNDVNIDRKEITQTMFNQALQMAQQQSHQNLIIIGDHLWNPGVIGLVASKVVENFYRPTIVWGATAEQTEILKASARSIKGFNIINAISSFSDYLVSHGGHPMAAGFSIENTNLENFSQQIQKLAKLQIEPDLLIPNLEIDCHLPVKFANLELFESIQELQPFGTNSEEPLFTTSGLQVVDSRAIGSENKHLKLKIADSANPSKSFDAIAFNFGQLSPKIRPGNTIDLAYHLDLNQWNGRSSIQFKVKDIKLY